jgi:hypothetical protein
MCVFIICFCLFSSNYSTYVFEYSLYVPFLVFYFVYLYSVFLYCFVYCFSPYIAVSTIFAQIHRPLLPGANPVAVNKYYIYICYFSHTHIFTSCSAWKQGERKTGALAASSVKRRWHHRDNRQPAYFARTDTQKPVRVIACVMTELLHVSIRFLMPPYRNRWAVEKLTK